MNNKKIGKTIELSFTFHNVGQGLFYLGSIGNFKLIYNVRTQNETLVNLAIERQLHSWKGKKINLLIISHLHEDHANGVPYLLENVDVDSVILPYLHSKFECSFLICPVRDWGLGRSISKCSFFKKIPSHHFVQFLTGDISLSYNRKKPRYNGLKVIKRHFGLGNIIEKLFVALVPHHGSEKSWNHDVCDLVHSCMRVISAGIINNYTHPLWQVIKSILLKCKGEKYILWSNEILKLSIRGGITIE